MTLDAPHLVICPLSVLSSWETVCEILLPFTDVDIFAKEAARWLPSFRTVRFHGPAPQRALLKQSLLAQSPDIVVTTYESFSMEDSWFKSHRWAYCVLDEGHKIKNAETNVATKLHGIGSLYRLGQLLIEVLSYLF